VAFVRKKRVHNNEYYQLVENYRENGKHRQRVLVHLGKHPNLESKIAAAAAEVEKAQERVTYLRGDLETLGEDIKRHYPRLLGGEWGGEIPTQPQLGELRYRVVQQRYGDEDYPDLPAGKSGFGDGPTHFWRYYWYLKTEIWGGRKRIRPRYRGLLATRWAARGLETRTGEASETP
jgi:hypothetical protein